MGQIDLCIRGKRVDTSVASTASLCHVAEDSGQISLPEPHSVQPPPFRSPSSTGTSSNLLFVTIWFLIGSFRLSAPTRTTNMRPVIVSSVISATAICLTVT